MSLVYLWQTYNSPTPKSREVAMFDKLQQASMRQLLKTPRLAIPFYQRGYAWEEEEVEAFVGDVKRLFEGGAGAGKTHFLGSVL